MSRRNRREPIAAPSQARVVNLYQDYKREMLLLNPDYQRSDSVWDSAHKTLLIETVLLGLPMPNFLLLSRPDYKIEVLDGVQRFTCLFSFIENQFALTPSALRSLKELGGKRFRDLPLDDQERIMEYEVQLQRVSTETELFGQDIGPELFLRVNNGVPISAPEAVLSQHVEARRFMQTLLHDFEQLLGRHSQTRLQGKLRRGDAFADIAQGIMGLIAHKAADGSFLVGNFSLRRCGNNPYHRHLEIICEYLEANLERCSQIAEAFGAATKIIRDVWGDQALHRQSKEAGRTNRTAIFLQFLAVGYLKRSPEWWATHRGEILEAWRVISSQPFMSDNLVLHDRSTEWVQRLDAIGRS